MSTQSELRNAVWQACTAIRNEHRDVKKYVEYTAVLLFFKFYDDVFESLPQDVKGIIPEKYRWGTLKSLAKQGFHGYDRRVLNRFREFFEKKLWRTSERDSFGVVFENFQFDIKHSEVLGRALIALDRINFAGINYDQKGDIYEFLIGKMGEAGLAGEFFTPRPIVDMIIDVLKPQFGAKVWDPACGTGGFLSRAFEAMRADLVKRFAPDSEEYTEGLVRLRYNSIYGNETESVSARLARMNMILRGDGHSTILEYNSLDRATYTDASVEIRGVTQDNPIPAILDTGGFDFVVANPPYGGTQAVCDVNTHFKRWHKSKKPETNFLQVMMRTLKPGGRCGVVMPEGVLFRRDDVNVRKRLLREFVVEGIVGLFKGAFEFADVKACVIFFRRPNSSERGRGTEKIWMAEARDFQDIERVAKSFGIDEEQGFARIVPLSEIDTSKFVLRPSKFINTHVSVHADCTLGDIFEISREAIVLQDSELYQQITVRLHGKGAVLRGRQLGIDIGTKRQTLVNAGDVVVSKIDAINGAFALVPRELAGSVVTPDFPVFRRKSQRASSRLLRYIFRYGPLSELIANDAQGTTNRKRVSIDEILSLPIPCPDETAQRDVLRRLDAQRAIARRCSILLRRVSRFDWLDDDLFFVHPGDEIADSLGPLIEDATVAIRPSEHPDQEWIYYGVSNGGGVHRTGVRSKADFREGSRVKRLSADVIVYNPMRVDVGSVGLMTDQIINAITSPDYVTFRCRDGLLPEFATILMRSSMFRDLIRIAQTGAVRPRLYLSHLADIRMSIPDIDQQRAIIAYVHAQLAAYDSVKMLQNNAVTTIRNIVRTLYSRRT